MKKIFLAVMAACAIFTGCSKENNDPNGNGVLVIKLPGNITRAVEDQLPDNQVTATVTNVEVFLINSNSGVVIDQESFTPEEITEKYKRIEDVPASVNKVVVVANIPAGVLSTVKGLTTYNAVKNYAYTIASQNLGSGGIDYLTMMGEDEPETKPDPSADPDGHVYKEAVIDLDALTARFEIGTVKKGTGIHSVELLGVWINSFYTDGSKITPVDATTGFHNSASPYWVTDPSTVTDTPSDNPFGDVAVATYSPIEYYTKGNAAVQLTENTKVYAYHVFAGDNIPHLILLVKGEYAEGYYEGDDKYFIGWLTFVNYLDGGSRINSIDANKIYRIGVGVDGIVVNAKDITIQPELGKFDLGIKVEITPWTRKNVTPSVD